MDKEKNAAAVFPGMICLRALIAGQKRRIGKVLYTEERKIKNPKEYAYLCHRAEEGTFELEICAQERIDEITGSRTHGGVASLCGERIYPALPDVLPEKGFFVMTEGIEDPYNFGYSLRSLYAAGVDGVILTSGERTGADGIVCRSSAGASERMDIFLSKPVDAVNHFKARGYRIISADTNNAVPAFEADLKKPLLLVIGGERRGITKAVLEQSDAIVRLVYGRDFDMALSAASAASILAFEVLRQNL